METNTARTESARLVAHAEAEGAEDYSQRASDVAAGLHAPSWAWPFGTADEAYLHAVDVGEICAAIGISTHEWHNVADEWCAAFRLGYKAAHALAIRA